MGVFTPGRCFYLPTRFMVGLKNVFSYVGDVWGCFRGFSMSSRGQKSKLIYLVYICETIDICELIIQ